VVQLTKVAAICLPAQQTALASLIAAATGWPCTIPLFSLDAFHDRGRKLAKMASISLGHLRTSLAD